MVITPPAIGAQIDEIYALHQRRRALEAQVEEVKAAVAALEGALMDRMDSEGLTRSAGASSRASITEVILPSVIDWDAFYKFIHRHKYYHLLERRASTSGCRELFETKGVIPGVQPFTKRRLNVGAVEAK